MRSGRRVATRGGSVSASDRPSDPSSNPLPSWPGRKHGRVCVPTVGSLVHDHPGRNPLHVRFRKAIDAPFEPTPFPFRTRTLPVDRMDRSLTLSRTVFHPVFLRSFPLDLGCGTCCDVAAETHRRRRARAMDATCARTARSWTPARCSRRVGRPRTRPTRRWSASGGDRTPKTASEGMRKTMADLNAILGEEEEETETIADTNEKKGEEVRRTRQHEDSTGFGGWKIADAVNVGGADTERRTSRKRRDPPPPSRCRIPCCKL